MRLAVIPARGGSKRIPRKNIVDFRGRPMIAWSIAAARASRLFDAIVVSTDDAEIAAVARGEGAEVPFMRPSELADDHAGTMPVVAHAIRALVEAGRSYDHVCCIYPAAPLIQIPDLEEGLRLVGSGWSFAFPVTSYAFPVYRGLLANPDGGVRMLFPEHYGTRSQDLPEIFHDAGQFYWGRTGNWLTDTAIYGPRSAPIRLPRWRVQDIDLPEDLERALLIFDMIAAGRGSG